MKPNLTRVVFGGIAAGVVINALELLFHRVLLDKQWTAAFAALGKKPTGWTTFIQIELPGWQFCSGAVPALHSNSELSRPLWHRHMAGIWVIPTMALMPLNLFPTASC